MKNKIYTFDLDNNLITIKNDKIIVKKGVEIFYISTDRVESLLPKKLKEGYKIIDESYNDFTDDNRFLNKIKNRDYIISSSAFFKFKEAVINQYPLSILTARGHKPETLKIGIFYLIKNEIIPNLTSSELKQIKNKHNIVKRIYGIENMIYQYLNTECSFYPVGYFDPVKMDKKKFMYKIIDKAIQLNNGKLDFTIGFSDDTVKNLESINSINNSNIVTFKTEGVICKKEVKQNV